MKKAQLRRVAVTIVLLASIIVAVLYLGKVFYTTNSITENSGCKNSILNHVASQKATGGEVSTDITCPTQYYTSKAKSEEEAKQALAESMKTCWETWGKGELQLFSRDNFYCAVCSVTEFDKKDMKINDFTTYLATENVVGGDETYAQYLKFYSTDRSNEDFLQHISSAKQIEIDTSKKYAAVFIYAKGSDNMKELVQIVTPETPIGGAEAGAALGSIVGFGAAYGVYSIGIITGPIGLMTIIGGSIISGGVAGGLYGLIAGNSPDYISSPMLVEYNQQTLERLGCKEFSVAQDTQKDKLG